MVRRTAVLTLAGALVVAGSAGCGLRDRAGAVSGVTTTDAGPGVGRAPAQVSEDEVDSVEAALDAAERVASELERQLAADAPAPS